MSRSDFSDVSFWVCLVLAIVAAALCIVAQRAELVRGSSRRALQVCALVASVLTVAVVVARLVVLS